MVRFESRPTCRSSAAEGVSSLSINRSPVLLPLCVAASTPMTIRLAPALIGLGLLVAALGCVMGLSSVHRQGVSCGSVFRPSSYAADVADLSNAMNADAFGGSVAGGVSGVSISCDAARSDRKPLALGGVIPGVVLALVGAGMAVREHFDAIEAAE